MPLRIAALVCCLLLFGEWWFLFGLKPLPFVMDLIGGRNGYMELWTERTSAIKAALVYLRVAEFGILAVALVVIPFMPRLALTLVVLGALAFATWLGLGYYEAVLDIEAHGGEWRFPPLWFPILTSGSLFAIAGGTLIADIQSPAN